MIPSVLMALCGGVCHVSLFKLLLLLLLFMIIIMGVILILVWDWQ